MTARVSCSWQKPSRGCGQRSNHPVSRVCASARVPVGMYGLHLFSTTFVVHGTTKVYGERRLACSKWIRKPFARKYTGIKWDVNFFLCVFNVFSWFRCKDWQLLSTWDKWLFGEIDFIRRVVKKTIVSFKLCQLRSFLSKDCLVRLLIHDIQHSARVNCLRNLQHSLLISPR